jgi:4'-phosphopantetheinyl transferase
VDRPPTWAIRGLAVPPGIEVRWLSLESEPPATAWTALSTHERERAGRFHHDRDRRRFVIGRHALRCALAERLGVMPGEVLFDSVGRGKPVLGGAQAGAGLSFSVAHSGDTAVIALAERPVGIDVEIVRDDAWDLEMAARVLSTAELQWLGSQPHPDRAFFRCWCRKEAFAKIGDAGLIDELRRVTLTPSPLDCREVMVDDTELWPGTVVACAWSGGGTHRRR